MDNPFIGQMDRKIDVFLVAKIKTAAGGVVQTETLIAQPFSYMKEVSGNEDPEGKIRHIINRTYTIRYNAQILQRGTELKVNDGGQIFDVYHVKELGRKKHLELLVTKNG